MEVTRERLAEALTEYRTAVRPDGGRVDGGPNGSVQPGWIAFPTELADGLFDALGRIAALNDDDVIDAHIHCEHAPESSAASELEIADQVVRLLQPLGYAGSRRLKRVLRWAWDYLADGDEPPF